MPEIEEIFRRRMKHLQKEDELIQKRVGAMQENETGDSRIYYYDTSDYLKEGKLKHTPLVYK